MRALIVKFSSIGDCVMAVPVAAALREQLPDAYLAWAIDPRCRPVLHEPLVDLKFEIPWERWKAERTSPLAQVRHYLQLRHFRFDVGVDLQGHAKTAICLRFSGARKRWHVRAFDPLVRTLSRSVPTEGAIHTVDRNLEALKTMGATTPASPNFLMPPVPADPMYEQPLATIAVGTGHPIKNYRRWEEVGNQLQSKSYNVLYVGGPGEQGPTTGGRSLVGSMSLGETMSLIAKSRIHLAADTGSGHIAAAYGVPVVSIFGTTDPAIFRPYAAQDRSRVLYAGPNMDGVTPDQVVEAAISLL